MRVINIEWSGPHAIAEINQAFHADTRFGIYQVYGPHPIYGNQQLLYIGKASARDFATRLHDHGWIRGTRDSSQVSIYLGRLCGTATPDDKTWCEEISLAERLLIYAHFPPYNTQKWAAGGDTAIRDVHVLNWKQHRDLMPEVSGLRWYESAWMYSPYGDPSHKKPNQAPEPTATAVTPPAAQELRQP